MWRGKGCIMYEIFLVNFFVNFVSSLPTVKPQNLKTSKPQNFFLKNLVFSSPVLSRFRSEQGQYAAYCTNK